MLIRLSFLSEIPGGHRIRIRVTDAVLETCNELRTMVGVDSSFPKLQRRIPLEGGDDNVPTRWTLH